MTGGQPHVTDRLAEFIAGSRWEDIPAGGAARGGALAAELCRLRARRCPGRGDGFRGPGADAVFRAAQASVIGRPSGRTVACRVPQRGRANVLEYDDTHLGP